ncbi:unnamed protein product [Coffea canephora]|uniref:Transcriptional factor DELLA N-terminal domain-containing protein n=1 Tax=Coffea canephora TaxID=49390 RepID=A0A068VD03_COFCA|nr:unnamed protein product [Coffea canephora]
MAEVAQKIEQLEEVFGNAENDSLSHLVFETVHYNPSDLSSWFGSMISELYPDMSSIPDSSAISDEFKHKSAKHEQTKMPFNSGQICVQSHRKSSKYAFLRINRKQILDEGPKVDNDNSLRAPQIFSSNNKSTKSLLASYLCSQRPTRTQHKRRRHVRRVLFTRANPL